MYLLRANDDTFCEQPLFCVIEMVYKRSTCNETVTELLLVLVGPCGGAGVKLIIPLLVSLGPSIMVKLDRDPCVEVGISMTCEGATIYISTIISLVSYNIIVLRNYYTAVIQKTIKWLLLSMPSF